MASGIDDTLPADTLDKTLEPNRAPAPDSAGKRAISDLARVSELPGPALGDALIIEEAIGYGGMGVALGIGLAATYHSRYALNRGGRHGDLRASQTARATGAPQDRRLRRVPGHG